MNVHSMITQCRCEVFRSGMANGHCGKQCIEVASTYLSPCKVWKKFSTFIFQLSGWALVVPSCFALHCHWFLLCVNRHRRRNQVMIGGAQLSTNTTYYCVWSESDWVRKQKQIPDIHVQAIMYTNSEITLHVTKVLSSCFDFHDKLLCYVVNRYFISSNFRATGKAGSGKRDGNVNGTIPTSL